MFHIILEKARVKGFTRVRRGKLERVNPFERRGEKKTTIYDTVVHNKPLLASIAQDVYNKWEKVGYKGMCEVLVDAWIEELEKLGVQAKRSGNFGHAWVVFKTNKGIFSIDIPYDVYETASSGFETYKKKPNVKFKPSDIEVYKGDGPAFYEEWKEGDQ